VALPWTRLAFLVPTVLGLARELLAVRRAPQGQPSQPIRDLGARVAALEETQRREAELLHGLAEQTAALSEAATTLRRQSRILLAVTIGAAVLAVAALAMAILR
jgi:hypothetical protein